jgi:hypothetical protein
VSNASKIESPEVGDPKPELIQPRIQAVFAVAELAERWRVHPESIRKLIRRRELKPLRAFRPYRITYDEVRRYETQNEEDEVRETYLNNRRRRT